MGQTGFKVHQTSFETIIQNGGQSIVKPIFNVYQTCFEIGTRLSLLYLSTQEEDKDGPFD